MTTLIIVQCGKAKVWDRKPSPRSVMAKDAYTSNYFKKNREYAEHFGNRWIILSAKHHYIEPTKPIENYDKVFHTSSLNPRVIKKMKDQIHSMKLDRFDRVLVLGGEKYFEIVQQTFPSKPGLVHSPFRGKRVGERMAAINKALSTNPRNK